MKGSCRDGRPRPSKPSEARQSFFRWMKSNAISGIGIVLGGYAAIKLQI